MLLLAANTCHFHPVCIPVPLSRIYNYHIFPSSLRSRRLQKHCQNVAHFPIQIGSVKNAALEKSSSIFLHSHWLLNCSLAIILASRKKSKFQLSFWIDKYIFALSTTAASSSPQAEPLQVELRLIIC